jgi:hypothetical protein
LKHFGNGGSGSYIGHVEFSPPAQQLNVLFELGKTFLGIRPGLLIQPYGGSPLGEKDRSGFADAATAAGNEGNPAPEGFHGNFLVDFRNRGLLRYHNFSLFL